MAEKRVRIENWSVIQSTNLIDFATPHGAGRKLMGLVYGHPRFSDGSPVVTTELKSIDIQLGRAISKNTTYELGEPERRYRDRFLEYFGGKTFIFHAAVTTKGRVKRQFLIKASTIEGARDKFYELDREQKELGDRPLIFKGQEVSFEPLEFDLDVLEI